ncbi:MAG: hypothetical protein KA401_04185 [Anaerolineae bacterium]|nr:hypothetical protein [Chloroflexota bacterium]MBP6298523.1 hypothetical protein [Anaerolineae bacterium]
MSNVWIANSEVVLSAALWWGRDGVERVWFGKGLEDRHFPKQHHPIYDAIRTLYADGQTITPETVLARMNGRGDIEVLRQLREQFNGWEAAGASAAVMRAEARAAWEQAALVRAVEQYRGGQDRDAIINELNQALTNSDGVEMQSTRISDINKRIISGEVSAGDPISTRLPWLDEILNGGLRAGQLIAIAGPEKSRKTSLTRNIALFATQNRDEVAVAMMNYENDVFITTADFTAMLAYQYLWMSNLAERPAGSRTLGDLCNGDYMLTLAPKYNEGKITGPLGNAYGYAVAQLETMNIHAWDVTAEYGGLDKLPDLERAFIKFKALEPNRKRIVIIDYAQLVQADDEDTLYANMRKFSRAIPLYAQRYGCAVIALSQQNDEYKKNGDSTKTTGTKGGGDLPAAVTSFFETSYDADEPNLMGAKRTRARRGAAHGKNKSNGQGALFEMHPPSGLIIGEWGKPSYWNR